MPKLQRWFFSQPVKFLFVGALNTLFGYLLFAGLIWAGLKYPYALLAATCLGILFNFKSLGVLVFNNGKNQLLLRFIVLYGVLYFINISLLYGLNLIFHNIYLNGIIAMLLVALISFFCNKHFIFG
ncbi:MAG TPA: GtrA family protein [Gammaproteobacteria bacterium]|nr:GtrA family protein [Gammaproteobacteria bacterium]